MKLRKVMICAATLVLLTGSSKAAQKSKCVDPSLDVTIVPIDGSALSGDSKGSVYTNGIDGVYNTVIHICGTNPTYDATLGLVTSKRSIGFAVPPAIDGSIIDGSAPVWANGVPFLTKPFLNVRNILWGRRNGQSTFTTRMGSSYIKGPGDASDYFLRFMPSVTDASMTDTPPVNVNVPSDTATVTVQDIPGTCRTGGSTLDNWIVTIDAPFVGTVYKAASGRNPERHSGQYHMPFQLLLKAKTCLPW